MSEAEQALLSNPVVLAGLVLVALIELGLAVWAIVDWAKRPEGQIRGNRVLWLLVIVLVNIVGPIVYLTAGRLPAPASDPISGPDTGRAQQAVDTLYAPRDGEPRG